MTSGCSLHSDSLMLDVLGEPMDPRLRQEWDQHLAACAGCRHERAALRQVIGRVRLAARPPELSARGADAMAVAVAWKWRNERRKTDAPQRRGWLVWRPFAAACALLAVVALGYRGVQEIIQPEPVADLQDIEVIRHLDLLREMDTIEKLVEVVDLDLTPGAQPQDEAPENETPENRDAHGTSHV